ncbi:14663_t:CDS:2, partial [Funneliformis caledonium]
MHQKSIRVADFGLSRKIAEASNNARNFGVVPYMDPKCLNNQNKSYVMNKKSDVYSIGVLMWQISSGHKPFNGVDYDVSLSLSIVGGNREKIIYGTPYEYSILYQKCWKYEPENRPNTKEVVTMLNKMVSPAVDHKEVSNPLTNDESSLKSDESSEIIIDNDDLIIDEIFDQFKNINSENNSKQNSLGITEAKINLTNPSYQIENSSKSSLDSLESIYNNEINRLQFQHYVYQQVWGSNFSAPVTELLKTDGTRILDVG